MRDILLIAIVVAGCVAALKRPWIGVMLWTWLSIMNPHRYTYGFAYSAPLAAAAVGATMIGLLMLRERASPFKGNPVSWFMAFILWMTLSWLLGLGVAEDYEQWKKVLKINGMVLVGLMILHSRKHIVAMMWVCAGSLALLGAKGGFFTLLNGGNYRVWGPEGSFIGGNNEFALALVVTIPLLRFLQLQVKHWFVKYALAATMLLCAAAALGSHSRGALLAIAAMTLTLWWRGKRKFGMGLLLVLIAVPLVAFMPDTWSNRMLTIQTYEEDASAMFRISAWWSAWNSAFHYPFGVGFNSARAELFARFSPYPDVVLAAHSIYFQVLGNHGFIGLALFMAVWISTWLSAGWLRTRKNLAPQEQWCADLGAMCQVALVGYAAGGAFLSLAYFDLPYNIMAMVVLTRAWLFKQSWKTEVEDSPWWMNILGLSFARKAT